MKNQKIITVTGKSGSGKTTLIERLVKEYTAEGKRVSVLKSMRHEFDIDREGKDTYRYREAGVHSCIISNGRKFAMMSDITDNSTALELALKYFPDADVIIIEGYKEGDTRKIEVIGDSEETPLFLDDSNIVMVVTDRKIKTSLPIFVRDDIRGIKDCADRLF